MKPLYINMLVCSILIMSGGCDWVQSSADHTRDLADPSILENSTWNLETFWEKGEKTGVGSVGITLHFTDASLIEGRSYQKADGPPAWNSYQGKFLIDKPGQLEVQIFGTTKVNEPEGSRYMEFLNLIEQADSYKMEGDRLMIYDGKEKALMFWEMNHTSDSE